LHICLELVWQSAVSRSLPFAAAVNDASVIELQLFPVAHADAVPQAAAPAIPSSAQVTAAAQQIQGWHRIGRCAPCFLSPMHLRDDKLALPVLCCCMHDSLAADVQELRYAHWHGRYSVQFPVESGAVLKSNAAVELVRIEQ
jgi:hypothetical protein